MSPHAVATRTALPALQVQCATNHFTIAICPARRYLSLVTVGFWEADVASAFGSGLGQAIATLVDGGMPYGTMRTMIDVRAAQIMPQALIATLQQMAAEHGPASERVAFLCGTMLQKMQYQRIAPQAMFAHFLVESDARSWLFAD